MAETVAYGLLTTRRQIFENLPAVSSEHGHPTKLAQQLDIGNYAVSYTNQLFIAGMPGSPYSNLLRVHKRKTVRVGWV